MARKAMILWEWGLPLTAEISGGSDSRTAGEKASGENGELHSFFVYWLWKFHSD
jgi:hypothetical protein